MRKESCFWLLILAVFTLSFVSCEGDNDPIPVSTNKTRTVLVYIVADNTLSSFAEADVNEMMEGMKQVDTSLYNLLVYVDGKSTPTLYHLVKNKSGNVAEEVVEHYEEQVSTDATVMKRIVNQSFNAYPADSYGLVYWSHGEGWIPYPVTTRWVGQDTGDGTDSRMNISDFATVLEGCPHLDFLLFDACFMQSVEVAYELRTYTDYVIASPTEIPAPGAPYDKVVPKMFVSNDEETVATEMGAAYFDYYDEKFSYNNPSGDTSDWTAGVSIGVLKTSALENLATVTKNVLPSSIDADALVESGSIANYDNRASLSRSYVGYYDMDNVLKSLATATDYTIWRSAFEAACIYWNTTPTNFSSYIDYPYGGPFSMEGTSGVSIYLPLSVTDNQKSVQKAYQSCAWYTALGLSKYGW